MKIRILHIIFTTLLGSFLNLSCSKFLEVNPPISRIVSQQVFDNDQTAMSALYGLNASFSELYFPAAQYRLIAQSADELYWTSKNQAVFFEFEQNSLTPKNSYIRSYFWYTSYKMLYEANSILNGISNNDKLSLTTKKQLESEAKTIRAFTYHFLFNIFGGVPLVTSIDYAENAKLRRSDSISVYNLILSDLNEAATIMETLPLSSDRTRIDKFTIAALLARCYLYQGEWQKALEESSKIIESGQFELQSDLLKVFENSNNKETIFQVYTPRYATVSSMNTAYANSYIPSSTSAAFPNYSIHNELLEAFAFPDKRKDAWMNSITNGENIYYYPFKYKVRESQPIKEYPIVVRLAEILLIRAEAYAELNQLNLAINELDKVRNRAGLASIRDVHTGINQKSLLDSIFVERQRELFTEYGHRWFDLKRSGRANSVFSKIADKNWQSTDVLYPIPFVQIVANPFLIQNPGYETY